MLLAIPNLGPGYGPQYVYWFLPLLTVCYVAVGEQWWRRLLLCTWIIVMLTYCFEYSILPTQGATLLTIWPKSELLLNLNRRWGGYVGQARLRLPMFLAYLCVLVGGVYLLRHRWKGTRNETHEI